MKVQIIAAYDAIHSQGVLHNDVELRHILISDEGTVQIIDWQVRWCLAAFVKVWLMDEILLRWQSQSARAMQLDFGPALKWTLTLKHVK